MEKVAKEEYQKRMNQEVIDSGLIIDNILPWLACTPDGLILKKNDK